VEWDLDRLSSELRAEIRKAEESLNLELHSRSETAFHTFRVHEKEHTAYFVVKDQPDGTRRFAFELLIN
jgi:hypothetical protein